MPGVWVVTPPACSNTLTVLLLLPRHWNTPSFEWINRLAAKYSCYHSFFLSCLLFSRFLPAPPIIQISGFAPLQATFCSTIFPPLLVRTSVSLYSPPFSLSTWLAVICQIPPWRLLCLNQSELTSFRLICTPGDWFSSLGIIWCSIPSLPEQIKL